MDRVHDQMDQFSAGERKVARTLLANYPAEGLESATALASASRVSTPTVLRFVSRLGYQGYAEFQRQLIHEVHDQMGSPVAQLERQAAAQETPDFLPYAATTFSTTVKDTFDKLPRHDFVRAVTLLADRRRSIRAVGGRFSHPLAEYLVAHLQMIRRDVSCIPHGGLSHDAMLADAGQRHVIVVFDYRRYQADVVELALSCAEARATIVLMTDQYLSPVAEVAEVVLPARVDAPSPFDSVVPAVAVVESLAAAVLEELGESARRRMRSFERLGSGPADRTVGDRTPGDRTDPLG